MPSLALRYFSGENLCVFQKMGAYIQLTSIAQINTIHYFKHLQGFTSAWWENARTHLERTEVKINRQNAESGPKSKLLL